MRTGASPLRPRALLQSAGVALALGAAPALLGQVLQLPPRPPAAPTGSALAASLASAPLEERENLLVTEILSGNVPNFLRQLCKVTVSNSAVTASVFVTPDYLAVGSEEDYLLTPLSPMAAQRLADRLDCSLPTRKLVDAIYESADLQLEPQPIPPSPAMTTMPCFSNHNARVRAQRMRHAQSHPPGTLVAGHKKDVVLSPRLETAPGKVAIYGWHRGPGRPLQPLYLGHAATWVDYSHGIRLVQQRLLLDGQPTSFSQLLTNPITAQLVSDEGPFHEPRYRVAATPRASPPPRESLTSPPPALETAPPAEPARFSETNQFGERVAWLRMEPGVRMHLNAPPPDPSLPAKKVLLIYYALPNGNTLEQTLGKKTAPGDDWHFNLQHIAAQTRFLRKLLPEKNVVLACLENDLKSWPAWRKQHGDRLIPELLDHVTNLVAAPELEIALSGHSGGGSLIFGFLNAVDRIPNRVARIAFLDANYAYAQNPGHPEKLAQWLRASPAHYLCVLAYNDAVALLEGKSFVGAAGGTWGRSHAMQQDLAQYFPFTSRTNAGFECHTALAGRIQFLLKENPERRVLHTVQVERNGFIHSMLTGTANEEQGYHYFGPPAYTHWITD